jgi:glycogen/starch synthases, ADP-glucose type
MIKVLIVGAEVVPFASTGGLGDVLGSLPAALAQNDIDVRVVMPLHSKVAVEYRRQMIFRRAINVKLAWRDQYCGIFEFTYNGVIYYFLDNEYYFKRESLYGNYDDAERYAFFSKAVLEIMPVIDFYPDILHTNDWHTALAGIYLKLNYAKLDKYKNMKFIHTLHNIEYQGEYSFEIMQDIFELSQTDAMLMDYRGLLNITKGAVLCCDKFTTVSPRYAEEIKTAEFSHNLHHILNMYSGKILGILNGIDTEYYKAENFTADDLSGKYEAKAALQAELGLPVKADTPVIGIISRLVQHKGLDLVVRVLEEFVQDDVQFVLLGTGDKEYEDYFRFMADKYPNKVKAVIDFDKDLSKRIYAASDIFLMPSKSEPCGLAQMICSQYGTIPLVREVGGLYDSIKNMENGFTFVNFNAHDMLFTLKNAVDMYRNDKPAWNQLIYRVMMTDFSWNVSAEKYKNLYKELID